MDDKSMMTLANLRLALLIFIFTLVSVMMNAHVHAQSVVNLTLLETAVPKGALCLDGSPPSYAYREGYGSGSSSWIVFLEGGGWCQSKEDCFNRSNQYLGSSYLTSKEGVSVFSGILDSDIQFNPYFYNWHKVFIHYCDGSSYMSNIEKVEQVRGKNLTFRGGRIYKAMMEEMLCKGMGNAQNAILTGASAGGLATILHCDEFRKLFPNCSRVKCISDSGFFIRGNGELAKVSERPFARVVATHELAELLPRSCTCERDPNLCLFPEYLVGDVATPLFLVESAFDTYQINTNYVYAVGYQRPSELKNCALNLALCNSTQLQIIKDFRPIFIDTLLKFENTSSRGMFVDSCLDHTHIQIPSYWMCSPLLKNKAMGQAISDWFFDRSSFREIDTLNYLPQNCTKIHTHEICPS